MMQHATLLECKDARRWKVLLAGHMHVLSSSGGPRVTAVAAKAAAKVQTPTAYMNVPVGPKAGSGLAAA